MPTVKYGATLVATYRYTTIFEREADGGFHAYCPALKGCHSQGDSLDEAIDNIREAIEVYLESVEAHGDPIPHEDLLIKPVEVAI
ncbi:MAG: type II toxin-antitoxin system HicB family antitoxin [Planctomycetota bacterium]